MALNFGNQNPSYFDEFEKRKFTLGRDRVGLTIVALGNAVTGTSSFIASRIKTEREPMGTALSYSANNQTGAARTINVTITNDTKGTTLYDFDLGVGGNSSITDNMFFSEELIASGDTVSIALGRDGVGTAAGATSHGSFYVKLNSIFLTEDETEQGL